MHTNPQPPSERITRLNGESVTPAIGASTNGGSMETEPIRSTPGVYPEDEVITTQSLTVLPGRAWTPATI